MKKIITLILLLVGMVCTVSADDPSFLGNSAININGTWYYAGNSSMSWCTGGAFNGGDLGTITLEN